MPLDACALPAVLRCNVIAFAVVERLVHIHRLPDNQVILCFLDVRGRTIRVVEAEGISTGRTRFSNRSGSPLDRERF